MRLASVHGWDDGRVWCAGDGHLVNRATQQDHLYSHSNHLQFIKTLLYYKCKLLKILKTSRVIQAFTTKGLTLCSNSTYIKNTILHCVNNLFTHFKRKWTWYWTFVLILQYTEILAFKNISGLYCDIYPVAFWDRHAFAGKGQNGVNNSVMQTMQRKWTSGLHHAGTSHVSYFIITIFRFNLYGYRVWTQLSA
jgi:hypothetical protein